jgi:hypothetical protein
MISVVVYFLDLLTHNAPQLFSWPLILDRLHTVLYLMPKTPCLETWSCLYIQMWPNIWAYFYLRVIWQPLRTSRMHTKFGHEVVAKELARFACRSAITHCKRAS